MSRKLLDRQVTRYYPGPEDTYLEANLAISRNLDKHAHKITGKRALDIGAGEIPYLQFYKKYGVRTTTCDISQNKSGSIDFVIEPDQKLPFEDNCFDFIFIWDVLEHVKKDILFVKECFRILKDGGEIWGNIPFMYRFHEEPYDFRRYTPSGLRYLFEEEGSGKVQEITPIGSNYLVARKAIEERTFPITRLKSYYLRFLSWVLKKGPQQDISSNCPFCYFFIVSN